MGKEKFKSNPLIEGKTKSCMKKYNGELPTTTPKPRPTPRHTIILK
jgi:hypothetical protein